MIKVEENKSVLLFLIFVMVLSILIGLKDRKLEKGSISLYTTFNLTILNIYI